MFMNRTVYMTHNGVKDQASKRLNVTFEFESPFGSGKFIEVEEKMNTAKALLKKFTSCFKLIPADQKTEAVFIAKHYGDGAQVKVAGNYRDFIIEQYIPPPPPIPIRPLHKASEFIKAFESFDILPVLKAFSIGTDIIWYYPTKGDKTFVIFKKKNKLQLLAYKSNELEKLVNDVSGYNFQHLNNSINELRKVEDIFLRVASRELNGCCTASDNNKNYKEALKKQHK
jgi:hypothetical protein